MYQKPSKFKGAFSLDSAPRRLRSHSCAPPWPPKGRSRAAAGAEALPPIRAWNEPNKAWNSRIHLTQRRQIREQCSVSRCTDFCFKLCFKLFQAVDLEGS